MTSKEESRMEYMNDNTETNKNEVSDTTHMVFAPQEEEEELDSSSLPRADSLAQRLETPALESPHLVLSIITETARPCHHLCAWPPSLWEGYSQVILSHSLA